ncbi:MAG TPA: hypothetical protein VF831_04405, partial [Anaerolineales bacterium]
MNRVSQFSNFIKRQLPLLGTAEIEALLNSFSQAASIVNNINDRIQLVNSKATELTAYTRTELTQLDYHSLFQAIKDDLSGEQEPAEEVRSHSPYELIRHGGSKSIVQLSFNPLGESNKFTLITFEPDEQYRLHREEEERSIALWDHLNQLSKALLSPDLEKSLNQVLQAGQALTGASLLCIYQVSGQNPSLQRAAYTGVDSYFPEEITEQDFSSLQTPILWSKGKRATNNLHRMAHALNTSYIASAPIGDTNAFIGLVVASGENSAPSNYILPQ